MIDNRIKEKMEKGDDKREFDRFPIDFRLVVHSRDVEDTKIEDRAVLENVSGGGAKFLTQNSDMYFQGQLLEITFFLPGANKIEAFLKAIGKVERIEPSEDSNKHGNRQEGFIAVKFDERLKFERVGVQTIP